MSDEYVSPVALQRESVSSAAWTLTHPDDADPLRFSAFTFRHQERDYRILSISHGDDRVQVHVSPTGRSVQIHVNGERVR